MQLGKIICSQHMNIKRHAHQLSSNCYAQLSSHQLLSVLTPQGRLTTPLAHEHTLFAHMVSIFRLVCGWTKKQPKMSDWREVEQWMIEHSALRPICGGNVDGIMVSNILIHLFGLPKWKMRHLSRIENTTQVGPCDGLTDHHEPGGCKNIPLLFWRTFSFWHT